MKINLVLKLISFSSLMMLGFSGCSQKLENDVFVVDKEYKNKNSTIKLYFVDNNYEITRQQLQKLVNDLNSTKVVPSQITTSINLNSRDVYYEPTLLNIVNNKREVQKDNKTALDFKFKLDENSNYIVVTNKEYLSKVDAYIDYENIMQGIFSQWLWNSFDNRDEYGVRGFFDSYSIDELELKNRKIIKFTTMKERVRNHFSPLIEKQIKEGGFQLVNTPQEADKIVEIEFGRDYNAPEIKELKKLGRPLDVKFASAKSDLTGAQTAMNVAGNFSNSSSVGAGVGIGFALIGALIPDNSLFVPIFIKVTDKKENKEYLIDSSTTTDPLVYRTKFMSDEIYEELYNSDIRNQQLSKIQRSIYYGIIKDLKGYQKILK
ncbi:hypothetical protein [Aliarcobacter butzleri]|uniref:hypothetical protein n=1 Tax=Aliarcobacter butzleri TaxID=28197 RepID=UPI00125F9E10|nr:hypothetical protein [Aliarcobacter butzleri]